MRCCDQRLRPLRLAVRLELWQMRVVRPLQEPVQKLRLLRRLQEPVRRLQVVRTSRLQLLRIVRQLVRLRG